MLALSRPPASCHGPTQKPVSPITQQRFTYNAAVASVLGAALALMAAVANAQDIDPKFGEVLSAVVAVHAEVPTTARTAGVLGTEREGSGVVIDANGLIVTIGYLILEAAHADITLADGKKVPVDIVGYDNSTGFGLLRAAQPIDVVPMKLGKSADLAESARVLVSSYGGAEAARPAIVVSRRAFAGYWEYLLENAIFTSPPYPNFGGAALISSEGELLGIGSLVVGDALRGDRQVPGNMFVPIDNLKAIMKDLLAVGHSSGPPRPWLGIYTEEIRGRLFVTRVATEGPAVRAGIQEGDIIVAIGDSAISSMADFYRKLWARGAAGIDVPLTVLKGAKLVNVTIRSGNRYQWLRLNPV